MYIDMPKSTQQGGDHKSEGKHIKSYKNIKEIQPENLIVSLDS